MQLRRAARAGIAGVLVMAMALGGCTFPRSGPTLRDLKAGADNPELGMHIVTVTPAIAGVSRSSERLGFGADFIQAGVVSPDTIARGDTVSVRVWENVDAGLLAGVGQKATTLEAIQVDQTGEIYVPYAGRIEAAGRSPDELRQAITEALAEQTPAPQVEVRRTAGDGRTVSVMGGVNAPGVYPIEAPTLRLSAMLAEAGGVALVPDVAQVTVERKGRTGRIWLQDLYDDPALDIALRDGDRIIVEEDRRSFTALGAAGTQARIPFDKPDMSALEAIASAGGLNGRVADPTGVFVFREEPAEVANRVLGRHDLVGPQRMAYLLDMTEPEGLFAARDFVVRDEDTIYVTEAPLASWTRLIAIVGTTVALTGAVERTIN